MPCHSISKHQDYEITVSDSETGDSYITTESNKRIPLVVSKVSNFVEEGWHWHSVRLLGDDGTLYIAKFLTAADYEKADSSTRKDPRPTPLQEVVSITPNNDPHSDLCQVGG